MKSKTVAIIALAFATTTLTFAGAGNPITHIFAPGETISSSKMNENFRNIRDLLDPHSRDDDFTTTPVSLAIGAPFSLDAPGTLSANFITASQDIVSFQQASSQVYSVRYPINDTSASSDVLLTATVSDTDFNPIENSTNIKKTTISGSFPASVFDGYSGVPDSLNSTSIECEIIVRFDQQTYLALRVYAFNNGALPSPGSVASKAVQQEVRPFCQSLANYISVVAI